MTTPIDAPHRLLRVLLLDNESPLSVRQVLDSIPVVDVCQASTQGDSCTRLEHESFDAILVDIHFGGAVGSSVIERLRDIDPRTPIIALARADDEEAALTCLQHGAQDYLLKEELTAALLARSLRHAISIRKLQNRLLELDEQLDETNHRLRDLLIDLTKNRQPSLERDARWILAAADQRNEGPATQPKEWNAVTS